MIPGCGPVEVAADEGIADASVGGADDGDADDGEADDGEAGNADAEDGDEDDATLSAFLPPLLAASLAFVLPCAADGDVFDAFDAALAGAACPDGEEADPDDVAVDAPAAEDPGGITVAVESGAPVASPAPVVPAAPVAPVASRTGTFALASGLGTSVVAATGAGITGCGNASRITGDVALSSARVSGNGSGAVAQPDATSATAMSEAIVAIRAPSLPGRPHPPHLPHPPDSPDLQIGSDISTSCFRAIKATAWSQ